MAQPQGSTRTDGGRLNGSVGTALAASHLTLGAGWGTTPVLSIDSGSKDQRGSFDIVCDATAAQATATIAVVYPSGAFASAPFVDATMYSDNAITDSGSVRVSAVTTTGFTITCDVLPVDTKQYFFTYRVIA